MQDQPASRECRLCSGTLFVYETVAGRQQVRRCSCRRGFERVEEPLERCRIPPGYRNCTLGNFVPQDASQRNAYERALAYCNGFPHAGSEKGLGLVFWGARRTGKTHLATGVLMELVANRGVSGRYWDFGALVKEIGRSYDRSTLITVMDTLESAVAVDLLLLDDLASRRIPDWAHNTLFEIVNARYMARRPTLLTTVFEDVDRDQAVSANLMREREFLIDRIGQRVRSRLLEMCLFVPTQEVQEPEARRQPSRPSTLAGMRRRGTGS